MLSLNKKSEPAGQEADGANRGAHSPTASRRSSDLGDWLRLEWDRVSAWVLVVVGLVILVVGYFKVSGTVYPAEQLPYIMTGGLGGLFSLGLGCMLWLSADLRDEWHKLDRIEAAIKNGDRSDLADGDSPDHGVHGELLNPTAPSIPSGPVGSWQSDLGSDGSRLS